MNTDEILLKTANLGQVLLLLCSILKCIVTKFYKCKLYNLIYP